MANKPPLGCAPRKVWTQLRCIELAEAISRLIHWGGDTDKICELADELHEHCHKLRDLKSGNSNDPEEREPERYGVAWNLKEDESPNSCMCCSKFPPKIFTNDVDGVMWTEICCDCLARPSVRMASREDAIAVWNAAPRTLRFKYI